MNHRPRRQAALNAEHAFAANRDNDNQLQTDSRLDGWNSMSSHQWFNYKLNSMSSINDLFSSGIQYQAINDLITNWIQYQAINDLFTNRIQCQASIIYLQVEFNIKPSMI